MKTQLYLWNKTRELLKHDLELIKDIFFEKIEPIFSDAEKDAEEFTNSRWNEEMNRTVDIELDFIDPGNIADSVRDAGIERYEILSLMRYRNLGMWITCLCQVWEQQLIAFIIQEMKSNGYEFEKDVDFSTVKECFKLHNQPFESLMMWPKIQELRWLVNTLKHAEGNSAEKLRECRPELFTWEDDLFLATDKLHLYNSTLLNESLNISNQDFLDYYQALQNFWDILPENMYSGG